jgi:2,5-dihydroxypyridine 5,6-dioxygenase
MPTDRIEGKWIDAFAEAFRLCKLQADHTAAILSETQSRAINVQLAELALLRLGARPFHIVLTTPRQSVPVPIRSTGASHAIQGIAPVVQALGGAGFVVDLTVEGLLHAPELPDVLKAGARVLMVSNEHPDVLERLAPDPSLESKVRAGMRRLRAAKTMRVTSPAGTELEIGVAGARVGGVWGLVRQAGRHCPLAGRAVPLLPQVGRGEWPPGHGAG